MFWRRSPRSKQLNFFPLSFSSSPFSRLSQDCGHFTIDLPEITVGHRYKYIFTTSSGNNITRLDPRAQDIGPRTVNGDVTTWEFSLVHDSAFQWQSHMLTPQVLSLSLSSIALSRPLYI